MYEGMFDMRLPDRLSLSILFTLAFVALAVLIYAYFIVDITPNEILSWSMLGLTGVCIVVMVVLAIATRDMVTRWLSAGLIGVVALEFSALAIASIGDPHSAIRSCPDDHILLHADSEDTILSEPSTGANQRLGNSPRTPTHQE